MMGRIGVVSIDNGSTCNSQISEVRLQAALVRTLLDEVERLVPASSLDEIPSEQLAEEITRLGHHLLDVAAAIALNHSERTTPVDSATRATSEPQVTRSESPPLMLLELLDA